MPCIYATNTFLRGDARFFESFRALHRKSAASIVTAIFAACYHLHSAYAGAGDRERADLTDDVWDVFNLVEVGRFSITASCGFLMHAHCN